MDKKIVGASSIFWQQTVLSFFSICRQKGNGKDFEAQKRN
jgi:hypothetical protein